MAKPSVIESFDWNAYRKRIEHEDALLNARVNILLVASGLAAASSGLAESDRAIGLIVFVALLTSMLLTLCTVQTAVLIRRLTTEYIKNASDPVDGRVREHLAWVPRGLRSTFILGVWLPVVVTAAWFAACWIPG